VQEEKQAGPLGAEEHGPQPEQTKVNWIFLITVLLTVVALCMILVPNFVKVMKARTRSKLHACQSNVKNIATALEAYATDNAGHCPQSLDKLADGKLMHALPTCPAAGKMTYLDYQVSTTPDSFSFSCCGDNHKPAYTGFEVDSTGFPKYQAELGLIDHP